MADDDDDEMHRALAVGLGGILGIVGLWLTFSAGGFCLTLAFLDSCLLPGWLVGLAFLVIGALLLWGGLDAYRQGEKTV